jgi:Cu/Ag efflux pump CusA
MFRKYIERPVLSTVISIIIVILGILGIVSLPVSQYPDIAPYSSRKCQLHGSQCGCSTKECYHTAGRAD